MSIVQCPHCSIYIEIIELNCKIFRCGIYKYNGLQINPHMSETECTFLIKTNAIYGCSKPFRITAEGHVESCAYL